MSQELNNIETVDKNEKVLTNADEKLKDIFANKENRRFKYGRLDVKFSMSNYDTMARYKEAAESLAAEEAEAKEKLKSMEKSPETIRIYCELFHNFFIRLFGDNAIDLMFDGEMDMLDTTEAYHLLLGTVREQGYNATDMVNSANIKYGSSRINKRGKK